MFCAEKFDASLKICKNEGNVEVRNMLSDSRKKIIDQDKTRLRHVIKVVEFCGRQESISKHIKVRETCFCEKIQADYTVSRVFQKYFNFVPMLESRNVDHMKSNCSDITVTSVFQNYFNFVPC